ncbi:MAG: Hpt domain-containing protein [Flavobacteriaceae bacterium]|jgi:HPt (histidine-containing phosphotransfer) domain-containing protein|nr:Hpt domain-containing protein [Flavobacteriaceae bacterium]
MSIFKANQKYDLSGLNELFGGNQQMINEIVMLFLEQAPRHIEEMQESHQQQNFDLLGIVAHKAKSSVVMLGLNELASKLSKIEKDTRDRKNYDGLEALLNEVLDEYKIVFDQFKTFLDESKVA